MFYFSILLQAVVFLNCLDQSFSNELNEKISENATFQSSWNRNENSSEKISIIRKHFIQLPENISQNGQYERNKSNDSKTEEHSKKYDKISLDINDFRTIPFLANVVKDIENLNINNTKQISTKTTIHLADVENITSDMKEHSENVKETNGNDKGYNSKSVTETGVHTRYSDLRETATTKEYNIQYPVSNVGGEYNEDDKNIHINENIGRPKVGTHFVAERRFDINFSNNGPKKEIDQSSTSIKRDNINYPVKGTYENENSYNKPKIVIDTDQHSKEHPAIRGTATGVRKHIHLTLPYIERDEYDTGDGRRSIYLRQNIAQSNGNTRHLIPVRTADKNSSNDQTKDTVDKSDFMNIESYNYYNPKTIRGTNLYETEYVNPKTGLETKEHNLQYHGVKKTATRSKIYNIPEYRLPSDVKRDEYDMEYEDKNKNLNRNIYLPAEETTRRFIPTRTTYDTDFSNYTTKIGTDLSITHFGRDNISKNVNEIDSLAVDRSNYYYPNIFMIRRARNLDKSKDNLNSKKYYIFNNMAHLNTLADENKNYISRYSYKNRATRNPNIENEFIYTPNVGTILSMNKKTYNVPRYPHDVRTLDKLKSIKDPEHDNIDYINDINNRIIDSQMQTPNEHFIHKYIIKENPHKTKDVRKFDTVQHINNNIKDSIYDTAPMDNRNYLVPNTYRDIKTITVTEKPKIDYADQIDTVFKTIKDANPTNQKQIGTHYIQDNIMPRKAERRSHTTYRRTEIRSHEEDEMTNYSKIIEDSEIVNTLKRQTQLLEQVAEVLRRKQKKYVKTEFDDILADIQKKKNNLTAYNNKTLQQVGVESVQKKILPQQVAVESVQKKRLPLFLKLKDSEEKTTVGLSTVKTVIDETEIRKALRDDPSVQRILKMAKRKRDQYMEKAKSYFITKAI